MLKYKTSIKTERNYSFLNYINNINKNPKKEQVNIPNIPFDPPIKVSYSNYINNEEKEDIKLEYVELYNNTNNKDIQNIQNIQNIKLIIDREEVIFYRIKKKLGHTSFYFTDSNNKYFMKFPVSYLEHDILNKEIFFLKKLEKYDCFPKLVFYNNFLLVTEYIGENIKKETIPKDILFQINNINNIFKKEKIIHCDIKINEMLIKDDKLYIIDFGWARYNKYDNEFFSNKKSALNNKSDLQAMIDIVLYLMNS